MYIPRYPGFSAGRENFFYQVYIVSNLILRELLLHRETSGINLSCIGTAHKHQPDSFQSAPRFLFVVSLLRFFGAICECSWMINRPELS